MHFITLQKVGLKSQSKISLTIFFKVRGTEVKLLQ